MGRSHGTEKTTGGGARSSRAARSQEFVGGRTSTQQSILNMVNCILGAGVLGYPYCFKSSGYVLGTAIMLVCLLACRFSYQLLLYCSQLSNRRTYEDLAEQAVGSVGRTTVMLCTAAMNMGSIVAYLNILADVLSAVAGTIIPPGAEPSRSVYLAGVTLFGALPVALVVRDHSIVAAFSTASVGFIVLFALVILLFACLPATPAVAAAAGAVHVWRMDGLLVAFPVMAYSFTAHPYYLGIYSNMRMPSPGGMNHVTDMALLTAGGLYWLVGLAGYFTFRSRTAGDLLRNFGAAHVVGLRGAYERAVKLCYGLSILGSVPLVILPFYNILLPCLGFDTHRSAGGAHADSSGRHKSRSSDDEDEEQRRGLSLGSSMLDGHDAPGCATSRPSLDDLCHSQGPRSRASGASNGHPVQADLGAGGAAEPAGPRRGVGHSTDVVDLKLQQDGIHAGAGGDDEVMASAPQHLLVVSLVLGLAMASAIWIPNVEFIFGLTGATASVIISYIMPALTFIRLLAAAPELTTAMSPASQGMPTTAHKLAAGVPPEVASEWVWRRRKAIALLLFGLVSGITCTDAILNAVKEEAVVVQLAQQLAAHEAVVVETNRAQSKAKEAVAAVSVVQTASLQLGKAQANASSTIGKLQQAADALSAISAHRNGSLHQHGIDHVWNIGAVIKEHTKSVADNKVLRGVEEVLQDVHDEVVQTRDSVISVVAQLDAAIQHIQDDAALQPNATAQGVATLATAAMPGAGTRVADLATELGKALGGYSASVATNATAGKSLQQVRGNAMVALQALDQTLVILSTVRQAVQNTKKDHRHDKLQLTEVAVAAMQAAVNATATSSLAMRLTTDALAKSASEETDELLSILTRVASDLQKSRQRGSTASAGAAVGFGAAGSAGSGLSGAGASTAAASAASIISSFTATHAAAAARPPSRTAGAGSGSGAAVSASGNSAEGAAASAGSGAARSGGVADGGSNAGGAGSAIASGTAAGSHVSGGGAAGAGAVAAGLDGAGGVLIAGAAGSGGGAGAATSDAGAATSAAGAGQGGGKVKTDALKKVIADLKGMVGAGAAAANSSSDTAAGHATSSLGTAHTTAGSGGQAGSTAAGAGASSATGAASGTASGGQANAQGSHMGGAGQATSGAVSNSTGQQGGSTGAGAVGTEDAATAEDVQDVAAVLQDAVALAAGTQATMVQEIKDTLGKANTKVQERVVGILKDMADGQAGAATAHAVGTSAGATNASAAQRNTADPLRAALGRAAGVGLGAGSGAGSKGSAGINSTAVDGARGSGQRQASRRELTAAVREAEALLSEIEHSTGQGKAVEMSMKATGSLQRRWLLEVGAPARPVGTAAVAV